MNTFFSTPLARRLVVTVLVIISLYVDARAQDAATHRLLLSGFEKPLDEEWSRDGANGGSPFDVESNVEKVKAGATSARWEPSRRPWLFLKKCPEDWSAYQALRVWIYAQEANGQKINFWINADGEPGVVEGKLRSYYFYQLKVDWTGWRQVVIDLNQCKPVRSPRGWNQISSLMISAKGGGAEPLPGHVLWWDEMELVGL
ncbi:MAG: hypothetical protein B9S32_14465 [Verrucomicrobia bacterium Tous-C9LFEB]|nr:MAG: hypothetical protein B9S32_14465 [Verrucomicrobia bacterium Tous-C9LFEB]